MKNTLSSTLDKLDKNLSPSIAAKSHIHLEDLNQTEYDQFNKMKHNFNKFSPLKDSMDSEFELSPVESDSCKEINDLLIPHFEGKMTCFYYTSKLLILGTDEGEIVELDRTNEKCRTFSLEGTIVTVDINNNSTIWAAGSSEGHVFVKKAYGGWAKKNLTTSEREDRLLKLDFTKIINLLFRLI